MEISYAVVYRDTMDKRFLIVHPTHETYWSLPKGGMEEADGGDARNAAARELNEETGISVEAEKLIDLGRFEYYRIGRNGKAKDKDLHIFLYPANEAKEISSLSCTSLVETAADPFPENDDYKYISYEEIDKYFGPDGARVLKSALSLEDMSGKSLFSL